MIATLYFALGIFGAVADAPAPAPAAALPANVVLSLEGDTIDLLLWRHRGRTAVLTEQTLALNPGLAARGTVLPAGIRITLPPIAAAPARTRETVKMWD